MSKTRGALGKNVHISIGLLQMQNKCQAWIDSGWSCKIDRTRPMVVFTSGCLYLPTVFFNWKILDTLVWIAEGHCDRNLCVTTQLWESVKMKLTLPKWGLGSPPGLPKLQNLIAEVKTPYIGVFFISLESYQSLDVENGLALTIWTSITYVIAKRKVGSQTGNLTPNH